MDNIGVQSLLEKFRSLKEQAESLNNQLENRNHSDPPNSFYDVIQLKISGIMVEQFEMIKEFNETVEQLGFSKRISPIPKYKDEDKRISSVPRIIIKCTQIITILEDFCQRSTSQHRIIEENKLPIEGSDSNLTTKENLQEIYNQYKSLEDFSSTSFKLLLLGDTGVGKTALSDRYVTNKFKTTESTIGVDFHIKGLIVNKRQVKLQIWDFGGSIKFRFLLSTYCKEADGGLFIYDTTSYASLSHVVDWVQIARKNAGPIPIIMVGTKTDLERREVQSSEAIEMAKRNKLIGYSEVSAKTGENVEATFEAITKLMLKRTEVKLRGDNFFKRIGG